MGCPSCGAESPSTNKFCGECGAALALVCDGCGTSNPPTNRYCGACGARIGTGSRGTAPSAEPAAPERCTPKHLAEKILASRAGLEGERKQVTVLFADVVGSTELIRDLDPEEAQRLLDGAVTRMMDAVHRYEGTVSRALGDGIMALFGAPLAHEDHALRACFTALAMQEAVRGYAEEAHRTHGAAIRIRIGLNSGEVIVRLISDDLHMDYTAMGQTVHLASRMEQFAEAGTTRLTADTLALVDGQVQVDQVGLVAVKGSAAPIDVFELVGAGATRTRLLASAVRGLSRYIGRDAELEALMVAQARAQEGAGQVVAVVGQPGIGKSRLIYEFVRSPSITGWRTLESGSVSYTQTTPYMPVVDLLKAYCQVEERDDVRAVREKLTGAVLATDPALESSLPALLSLLDVPVEEAVWQTLEPPRRREWTLAACRQLLLAESARQPLVIVVENLHWLDSETQALLDSLVESLAAARILLVVSFRPEYRHSWGTRLSYTQIQLDALRPERAGELLEALVGHDPSVRALSEQLVQRTQGNPFFLEECFRALVEAGALVGERGAYRLTQAAPSIELPATVQAVLAARIDRLVPRDKYVLQVASVIGKDVSFGLLSAIAELAESDLQAALARLQAAEFLYEASLFPELEYTFKHALTHEVAYGSLLRKRRQGIHAAIVEAIERLQPDRLVEHVERLAHHAARGEMWDKAADYARRAGLKAASRSAHREAAAFLDEALAALGHLPRSPDVLRRAIDLRLDLRASLNPIGEMARLHEHLREAEALAELLGDHRRLGRTLACMAQAFAVDGDHRRAVEVGARALTIATIRDDVAVGVMANCYLAQSYWHSGEHRQAVTGLRWNVARLRGDVARERFDMSTYPVVWSRSAMGECLAELGDFGEAVALSDQAVAIAESLAHPYSLIFASWHAGSSHLIRGDTEAAILRLERALELARARDIPRQVLPSAAFLGAAYALAGRADDALPLLEQAIALQPAWGTTALFATRVAEAYRGIGHGHDAARLAAGLLMLARKLGERGSEAWLLHLLGDLTEQFHTPDLGEAHAPFHEALALAEELGMRPLQARSHLGLGKLYRRTGRLDEARAELSTAVAMLCEMGMAFWLPEAEAELAELAR